LYTRFIREEKGRDDPEAPRIQDVPNSARGKYMGDSFLGDLSREAVRVDKGTVIMREGEMGQCAYFVVHGRLLVEKNIDGENVPIAEIEPRDIVGELAILDDAPRSATVTAMEDSLLVILNKDRIRSIIRRSPAVAEVILKLICHKLRNTHQRMTVMTDLTSPDLWRKVLTLIQLTVRSEPDLGRVLPLVSTHCRDLLDVPGHRIREIFHRLNEAGLMQTRENRAVTADLPRLQNFLIHCQEEYSNQSVQTFSSAKIHAAARLILSQCPPEMESQEWVDWPRGALLRLLAHPDLWRHLRLHYQNQRAEALLGRLLQSGWLEAVPPAGDPLRVSLAALRSLPEPREEIEAQRFIETVLFKPLDDPPPPEN